MQMPQNCTLIELYCFCTVINISSRIRKSPYLSVVQFINIIIMKTQKNTSIFGGNYKQQKHLILIYSQKCADALQGLIN